MGSSDRLRYKLGNYYGVKLKYYGPKKVDYIYTKKQAAAFCERSESTIQRWMDIGLLPALKTCVNEDIPAEEATVGVLYFLKTDLVNAMRVEMGVPTKGFNVEDHT